MVLFADPTILSNKALIFSKNIILFVILSFKTSSADLRFKQAVIGDILKWVKSKQLLLI
jgi:hypothetical protein